MAFVDKKLVCKDCNANFIFTAGEQEFYAGKGLQNEPARCPRCRTARRTARAAEPEEGYVRYGVFASFGGKTPRQMHPAACAECGVMTEVPFIPRGTARSTAARVSAGSRVRPGLPKPSKPSASKIGAAAAAAGFPFASGPCRFGGRH